MKKLLICSLFAGCFCVFGWASEFAPAVPDLALPMDTEEQTAPAESVADVQPKKGVHAKTITSKTKKSTAAQKKTAIAEQNDEPVINVTNSLITNDTQVEKVVVDPNLLKPIPQEPVIVSKPEKSEKTEQNVVPAKSTDDTFVAAREGTSTQDVTDKKPKTARVVYNPPTDRDPTLSPDDALLLKHREEERLKAIEAEKQRRIEAERKRLAELERKRQLELEYLRDPSREVRGKIRISGIVGQEVFIGDKVYSVGKSVLGARIISVQPDSVVFIYKGQKFTKKVRLQ